jgi:hypothetical protein
LTNCSPDFRLDLEMHTLTKRTLQTAPGSKVERLGYGLVAIGYTVMTLGILEIGGVFNVVCGLVAAWGGCILMFAGEERSEEETEFRRLVDNL